MYEPSAPLNADPHPRIAVLLSDEELRGAWVQLLQSLYPSVRGYKYHSDANWNEFDCIFTDVSPVGVTLYTEEQRDFRDPLENEWTQRFPPDLDIFCFFDGSRRDFTSRIVGCFPPEGHGVDTWPDSIIYCEFVTGRHISPVSGLSKQTKSAVDQVLVPASKNKENHQVFQVRYVEASAEDARSAVHPLLNGPDNQSIALRYDRPSGASAWIIPQFFDGIETLVRAAFAEWHTRDPKRYPALPDWEDDPEFATARELEVRADIDSLDTNHQAVVETYEKERAQLQEQLDAERVKSGDALRALLKDDGPSLERAVADALERIGFEVEDRDEVNTASRREDFRISIPDDDEWIAICEVKGSTGGASPKTIQQAEHHTRLYLHGAHRSHVTPWIVLNTQRRQHPRDRERPYQTRLDDIGNLEESGILALDTRALFELVRLVEQEPEQAEEVRTALKRAVGVVVSAREVLAFGEDEA